MTEHDYEATKILFLFEGIRHIQSEQGYESFDDTKAESLRMIDEILNFKYEGDNPNIQHGFQAIKFWSGGLKLIRQKISEIPDKEFDKPK